MCWPFMDVELEDAPPKKEEKKEKRVDVLVDDNVNLVPIPQPSPVYYASHAPMQYYTSPLMVPYNPSPTYALPAVPPASHHVPAARAPVPAAPVAPAPAPSHNDNANGPWAYYGKTKAQIDEENRAIAHQNGAYAPAVYVPKEAGPSQQYWCRELEGCFTLRNVTECHEAGPGYWTTAEGGFPMYVRTAK